jgi:hypothetical protein
MACYQLCAILILWGRVKWLSGQSELSTDKTQGIDRGAAHADTPVKVGAGGASGLTHMGNNFPLADQIAFLDFHAVQMDEDRTDPQPMVDHEHIAHEKGVFYHQPGNAVGRTVGPVFPGVRLCRFRNGVRGVHRSGRAGCRKRRRFCLSPA